MMEKTAIYKCLECGNVVEVLMAGGGELWCCGQAMVEQVAKSEEEGREKHLPVIERVADGYVARVGEVAHPMTSEHQIEWIELVVDDQGYRQFLFPGAEPRVKFRVAAGQEVKALASCNLHGLWEKLEG
jgi:superoxide reductase